MKNFLTKTRIFIINHKKTSIAIAIVILLVGYWGYKKATNTSDETRYVMGSVTRGTIISTVSGTGQVSASSQIDIKPKVSGTITHVAVKPGDKVSAGQTLFQIDSTDAQKTLRDAKINLEAAQLSLQKLEIQNSTENTDANLDKAYSDGFSSVSSTFVDLPTTITGIQNILNQNNLSDNTARNSGATALNYRNSAESDYYKANDAYQKSKLDFGTLDYNSPHEKIDSLISEAYNATKLTATAVKSLNDYVSYLSQDTGRVSDYSSYQTSLAEYTTSINGHLSALSSAQTSIKNYKDAVPNNNIDLQSAQITVTQRKNTVSDAEQTLSDYYIKAPFDGVIASVPVLKGDNASSATVLGTIITAQQVAVIPFNEVDVAQIQLEQKVTLTFDAIPDLTISGKVVQIDSVGTVSSGVVNYNVKISFDTSDPQIKPGMSANANIITNMRQDVLTVPNSAVKTLSAQTGQDSANYVQMFDAPLSTPLSGVQGSPSATPPKNQTVVAGVSNDTNTEIISGLNEGDSVVIKTIKGTTSSSSTTSTKTSSSSTKSTRSMLGGAMGGGPPD